MMQLNFIQYAPFIEKARTSFWFVPSCMLSASVVLAVCAIYIDAFYIESLEFKIPLIYGTDIDAIRSLLGTIAGSMITVTSIAFSITIVALTLASSQFGPRLLRNFMMDSGTQFVLGSFISNFLFCILVFCAISFHEPFAFKPGLSVIIAVMMTCLSVGVLIYFIHHVAKSIQADVVIDEVYRDLLGSIEKLFPSSQNTQEYEEANQAVDSSFTKRQNQLDILATCSGYVQTTNHKALVSMAIEHGILIECRYIPGDFVVQDAILAIIHSDTEIDDKLIKQISQSIMLGAYRTPVQDPEFAIHQLVEIALRALSPGINDPYTAITCIDKLNSVLCSLTKRTFPDEKHYDQSGMLRVVCKVLTFKDIASAAFNQIRQEAESNVAVTIRLLDSLSTLKSFARSDEHKDFVLKQTKMIEQQQLKQPIAEDDLRAITSRIELLD